MTDAWESLKDFLSRTLLGAPLHQWVLFLAVAAGLFLALRAVWAVGLARLKRTAERTTTTYDDYAVGVLARTRWFGELGAAVFLALYCADLNGDSATEPALRAFALVLLFVQIGYWGTGLIDVVLARGFRAAGATEGTRRSAAGVVRWFGLVFVWGIVFLLILSAFHVEITPLIAGLGVGGIAVAFALQQILSDVFCSVAIVLDRPFEVGDFIVVGDYLGAVEHIGIKTTRLRSLGGEQIVMSNSDLLGSRIRNFKRMEERRVVFGFGVLYSTDAGQLERIPPLVQQIILDQKDTRFDRAHFQAFGDSAVQFEVVYYVLTADYNRYMNIQQAINLELLRRFRELGVEMAYPSRTLYFDRSAAGLFNGAAAQVASRDGS